MKNVALNELRGDVKPDQALRDILLNKWGPKPDPFGVGLILEKFSELWGQSSDHLVTFRELWFAVTNEPWKGIGSRRILSISLSRLLQFCVRTIFQFSRR